MTHLIIPDPALEELRRQLRENEITLHDYKRARALLIEPAPVLCSTPGCGREAHTIERGQGVCGVCGLRARSQRRARL